MVGVVVDWGENSEGPRFSSSTKYDFNFSVKGLGTIYTSPKTSIRLIRILDLKGRVVRELQAREARIQWDGLDNHDIPVKTGLYVAQLIAQDRNRVVPFVLAY